MRSQLVEMLVSLWERRYVSAESGVHFEGKTLWASWSRTVECDDSERTTYYILRLNEGQLEGLRSRISAYSGDSVLKRKWKERSGQCCWIPSKCCAVKRTDCPRPGALSPF